MFIVASIVPACQREGVCRINGEDTVLQQQDSDTLLFGSSPQLAPYQADSGFPANVDSVLQECLSSSPPFVHRTAPTR